ncbi:hypothetical protein ACIPRI_15690 [Variovorax sp. LARHSF232]
MADLASEVRDDLVNRQQIPDLPMNLYQHLFDASFHELVQEHDFRPVFHEKASFVNEVGPLHFLDARLRKVSSHEFVDATWVHLGNWELEGAGEGLLLAGGRLSQHCPSQPANNSNSRGHVSESAQPTAFLVVAFSVQRPKERRANELVARAGCAVVPV